MERETSLENQKKMLAHLPKPSAAAGKTSSAPEKMEKHRFGLCLTDLRRGERAKTEMSVLWRRRNEMSELGGEQKLKMEVLGEEVSAEQGKQMRKECLVCCFILMGFVIYTANYHNVLF